MSKIIESSENTKLETMLTIQTDRGEEYVINAEQLALAFADLMSDQANEIRFGWDLQAPWYKAEIARLESAAFDE